MGFFGYVVECDWWFIGIGEQLQDCGKDMFVCFLFFVIEFLFDLVMVDCGVQWCDCYVGLFEFRLLLCCV